jgi:hypothetical protein
MSLVCSPSEVPLPTPDFGLLAHTAMCVSGNAIQPLLQPLDDTTNPFPSIDSAGLRDLIRNYAFYGFESLVIVDARFDYEYAGGHISGSVNVRSKADMERLFAQFRGRSACVVFHCEFSANRGPALMRHFREHDRRENIERYPFLDYPTIYLLEGGYSLFFEECPHLCDGGYVPMRDPRFIQNGELKRSHSAYGLRERRPRQRSRRAKSEQLTAPVFIHDDVKQRLPVEKAADPFIDWR